MSKCTRRAAPTAQAGAARSTVTVCRGCCGTAAKVPRLDHEAQLTEVRTSLAGVAMARRTDCLDACERANGIVIQRFAEGRKAGGRPVWLGQVNDPDTAADITAWVKNGGPGLADPADTSTSTPSSPPATSDTNWATDPRV